LLVVHRAHPQRYPHLLESVAYGTSQARYDILFAFPEDTLSLQSGERLLHDDGRSNVGDFLHEFERKWRTTSDGLPIRHDPKPLVPFTGGWFVYLGYELAGQVELKLRPVVTDPNLPVAYIVRAPAAIIRDHLTGETYLMAESNRAQTLIPEMCRDAQRCVPSAHTPVDLLDLVEDDPTRYLSGVERILTYIQAGDVFQVNLSRAWQAILRDPVNAATLYERLRKANPAPFAGLMTLGPHNAILSSSPERLVAVRQGRISTRPIAGTYPRSDNERQDQIWSRELLRHPKERAEHVMLIDLERNDLGRVCQTGSVEVTDFMVLESYRHVHHIVSEVVGVVRDDVTPAQIIRAVFPGGTITGCPKVRCMEIIAELESDPRGPCCSTTECTCVPVLALWPTPNRTESYRKQEPRPKACWPR
jgi:anthranilate synthase component 1